ncbi:MAG: LysR substrate-binding domain-containing protein, partial [Thermoleophilia bacterium]
QVPFFSGFCAVSQLTFSQERGHLSAICYLIAAVWTGGSGLSFLVESAVAEDLAQGRLVAVPIEDQNLMLDVNIAYLEEDTLSPAAAAFLKLLLLEK